MSGSGLPLEGDKVTRNMEIPPLQKNVVSSHQTQRGAMVRVTVGEMTSLS